MYFFDLVDYYTDKVIGNQYEQIPICDVTWSDMATTSRATSDTYFKALNEWYECGTTCLEDGECKDAILAKWVQVMDDRTAYLNARTDFWEMMGEECSTDGVFNKTIYDDYITAQQTLLCDVEELTSLVDNGVQPNPCPNCIEKDITIGEQVWARCNLSVSKYRDGTDIPEVTNQIEWDGLTTGAWCHYDNDPANEPIYGKLYNWYAVNDILHGGLAPTGYHIPTDIEWTTLTDDLGGLTVAGGKMKETGLCHWNSPNNFATNTSRFSALAAGYGGGETFSQKGVGACWWSSTESNAGYAWMRYLQSVEGLAYRSFDPKYVGHSVRVIKD